MSSGAHERHLCSERTVPSARLSWWLGAFLRFGRLAPTISCTLYKRMYHTRLAQYYRTRILQGFLYRILPIDQFFEDDFLCTVADVIHSSDPCQLIPCFQLLIDTFFFCQLRYEQVEFIASLSINIGEIAIQLTAEKQIGVDDRAVLSEVLMMLSAPDTNGVDFLSRNDQTRQIIISMQFIPKSVAVRY